MALLVPNKSQFNYVTGNVLTTAPTGAFGTSVVPGTSNAYSAYVEILSDANVTRDCYGIMICLNNASTSTASRNIIVTIGIDTAGGTSYVDLIPHLLAASAAGFTTQSHAGHWYYFPIYIPAGSAIAAKAAVNNAGAGSLRVACWLFGAPSSKETLIYGHGVEAIGVTTASSSGTAVTPGNATEGSWTSLGTTSKPCFAWQQGFGIANGTMTALVYNGDISYGNGTNQIMIDQDRVIGTTGAEAVSAQLRPAQICNVPVGGAIYGRLSCSSAPDTGISMAAYGVY
jgi:hypothetical protein